MKNKMLIIISVLFLILASFLAPLGFGFGKTGKETTVLGKNYSLLSKKEIMNNLELEFPMEGELIFRDEERVFVVNLASISAKINTDETASNLLFRRLKQGLGKYIKAFYESKDFELEIDFDEEELNKTIAEIASQIDKPFIPAEIILNKNVEIVDGELGQTTKQELFKEMIITRLKKYEIKGETQIPVEIIGEIPSDSDKEKALEIAKSYIGKSVTFKDNEVSTEIDDKVLVNWISFGGGCQAQKVSEYVDNLSLSLKKEAQDAVFKFENGKVIDFLPAKEGYSIDSEKMKTEICRDFLNWKNLTEKNIVGELPLLKVQPKINNSDVNNLGIKELLGRGTSSFKHSSEIRNWNVEKGASIVNRILVAPGETFSFIKSLGEVSLDNGYKKAYIIRQGRTVLDVGGGVCQVSTTLFRAMLDAGVSITERQPHAYRVSYYEEDTKPGFDATVFIPKPDLAFINDTSHHLLIQSYYDGINKKLTYEIYGTSDGRKTVIDNYKQWGAAPAPPEVWIDDPTLPLGKVVKDESAVPGLKTAFDWTVTRNGEIIHKKTFTSSYVPWAAVYRRGTGQ
ncbi:MAG: VanW family protein [Candidatus Shapirobacteria bacterium]|jgi:vancomycin resistance protein YoaR|nr:VanW family protein [Candidatus Shapirobacteria bacterium]